MDFNYYYDMLIKRMQEITYMLNECYSGNLKVDVVKLSEELMDLADVYNGIAKKLKIILESSELKDICSKLISKTLEKYNEKGKTR